MVAVQCIAFMLAATSAPNSKRLCAERLCFVRETPLSPRVEGLGALHLRGGSDSLLEENQQDEDDHFGGTSLPDPDEDFQEENIGGPQAALFGAGHPIRPGHQIRGEQLVEDASVRQGAVLRPPPLNPQPPAQEQHGPAEQEDRFFVSIWRENASCCS